MDPDVPAAPTKTSASWSLATVWCPTRVKLVPKLSVTDAAAFKSTKAPTMIRSPEVTPPAKALLAVLPIVWDVDVLCTNVGAADKQTGNTPHEAAKTANSRSHGK